MEDEDEMLARFQESEGRAFQQVSSNHDVKQLDDGKRSFRCLFLEARETDRNPSYRVSLRRSCFMQSLLLFPNDSDATNSKIIEQAIKEALD